MSSSSGDLIVAEHRPAHLVSFGGIIGNMDLKVDSR
jgi:hypothetical protein